MVTVFCTLGSNYESLLQVILPLAEKEFIIFHRFAKETIQEIENDITERGKIINPQVIVRVRGLKKLNLSGAVKLIRKLINTSYNLGEKIIACIAGGDQLLALALMLSCYVEHDKVDKLFYLTESGDTLALPIIPWTLSGTKRKILGILSTPASVKNLAGELGISQGMTYKHLKDLLNEKYITETLHTFELTLIGRIMASPLMINNDDFEVKDLPVKNTTD